MDATPLGPGWFDDPRKEAAFRWWDGQRWTDNTYTPGLSSDWRSWVRRSRRARQLSVVIVVLGSVAAATASAIIVAALIRQRPTPGLTALLIPAIPTILLGQVWMIGLMTARQSPRPHGWRVRTRQGWGRQISSFRSPIKFFFGDLPPAIAGPILSLAVLGWLSAMTAFPSIARGGPAGSGDGCAYRLSNHGTFSCVSRHVFEQAGAGVQRFAAGILLSFFCLHTGAALGNLRERRRTPNRV